MQASNSRTTASPTPLEKRFGALLLALTASAVVVRTAFLLLEPATRLVADERTWTAWALESLLSPQVHFSPLRTPMLFHPPLFPYFIGTLYGVFGTLTAVKWAQVLVSALLVPALGRIGRRLFGARAGLVTAGLVACYPELIWYSAHFWCETLLLTCWWWAFERVLAAEARSSTRLAALGGLLFGLSVLTREIVLYAAPLAALYLASGHPRRKALRVAAAFVAVLLLTVGLWTYRNWVVFRAFVPVSTAGGLALLQGNAPLDRQRAYDVYYGVDDEVERYRQARRLGLHAIRERQPWWLFEKLGAEGPRFWETDSLVLIHVTRGAYGPVSPWAARATAAIVILPYLAVLGLSIAGLAGLRLDRASLLLLGTLCLHFALHVATHGFARYRLPVMPVLFLLAGWAAALLWERRFPRLSHSRWSLAAVLAALALVVVIPSIRGVLAEPAFAVLSRAAPES